eukprot:6179626-Pleurochrysis_carterae.AAC.2
MASRLHACQRNPSRNPATTVTRRSLPGYRSPRRIDSRFDVRPRPVRPPGARARRRQSATASSQSSTALLRAAYVLVRRDGIVSFLARMDYAAADSVDNDPAHGGATLAALRCRLLFGHPRLTSVSFCVSRFFFSSSSPDAQDGGPPPVRDRENVTGLPDVPEHHAGELAATNELVRRQRGRPSCKAEIVAASEAPKEAVYLRALLSDLGYARMGLTSLAMDNKLAIDLAYNPEHHQRKHIIHRRHFFEREKVKSFDITVPFVRSADTLADLFIKPRPPRLFFLMRGLVRNVER